MVREETLSKSYWIRLFIYLLPYSVPEKASGDVLINKMSWNNFLIAETCYHKNASQSWA